MCNKHLHCLLWSHRRAKCENICRSTAMPSIKIIIFEDFQQGHLEIYKKTYNQWRHIVRILEIFVGCKNFAKNSFDSLAIIRLVSQAFSPSLSRLSWCNGVQYCGEGVTGDFPIDASKHHHSLKMLPLLQRVGGPNKFNKIFFLSIFFIIYWVLVTWSEHGTVLLIVI